MRNQTRTACRVLTASLVACAGIGCAGPKSDASAPDVGVPQGGNASLSGGGSTSVGGQGGPGATPGGGAGSALDVKSKSIHRLSNVEYDNTVNRLLGTSHSASSDFAPPLDEAEGFDNIASALTMNLRQLEDYFRSARELAAMVFEDPTLRDRIVTCPLDGDTACAQTVLSNFGLRAFRRPLEPIEEQWLLGEYEEALTLTESPMDAMEHMVRIVLSAPQFLYRIEFDPDPTDPTPHPLTPYELASRLSYALWSSMPDDALFSAAASGDLLNTETLRAEVDRMLGDANSEMLVTNFAAQWFGSRRLAQHVASTTIYPGWSAELASSMQQEMELYFSELLRKDLPYTDLLTADFNFVDATLARHYGMAPPTEPGFSHVTDASDGRRGLIGLAGFLTHTSRETTTSPILRGAWILNNFVCAELHVPDGLMIDDLPAEDAATPTTVRERVAAHRDKPECTACHNMIDPVGFALENFDGVGLYRDAYENGLPVDATGVLPNGTQVGDLESLAAALTDDADFLSCAVKKFNTYALGRTDTTKGHLNEIVERWKAQPTTLRNLIKETVTHTTFTTRRAEAK